MSQAEQATTRVADAADRLSDVKVGMDSSASADFDSAAASAESAAGSMENAAGSAETMGGGMDSASASAESASAGLDTAGASADTAAAGLEGVGGSAEVLSSALDGSGASSQDFAASLSTVGAQSQGVTAAMLGVSTGAQGASDSAMTARGAFSQFGSEMRSIAGESRAFGLGLAAIGGGITALLGSVVQTGIAYNTLQQVAGRALETMTGSAEAAAGQMERLHEFADTSPFGRDTWITAQQQLMAFGMEAERIVPTLEGVQNAVAAIGGGDAEIRQLVDILGSVEGQGRITGRELQRMGQMGINAADLMGSALGMTGNEIRTQITSGALDAETAITALTDGMNTQFAGAAEGLRDTMEGSLDRIRARIRDIGSVLATPLVDPAGGGFLVDAINMAADFGSTLLDLPPIVLQVTGGMAALAGGVALAGGTWALAGTQVRNFAAGAWDTIRATGRLTNNLAQLAGGWRNVGIAAGVAAAGIAAIAALDYVWDRFTPAARDIDEVTRALRDMGATGEYAGGIEDFGDAFNYLDTAGGTVASNMPNWAAALTGTFNPAATSVISAAQNMAEEFEHVDEALSGLIDSGDVENAAAAFSQIATDMSEAGATSEEILEAFPQVAGALTDMAQTAGATSDEVDVVALAMNRAALEALFSGESWVTVQGILNGVSDGFESTGRTAEAAASGLSSYGSIMTEIAEVASDAASSLGEVVDAYRALGLIQLDAYEATREVESAFRDLDASIEENGTALAGFSDTADANYDSLRSTADATWDWAAAQLSAGESASSVSAGMAGFYDQLVEVASGMDTGSMSAEQYVAMLMGIPESRQTDVEAFFEDFASDGVMALHQTIEGLPEMKRIRYESENWDNVMMNAELLDEQVRAIEDQTVSVIVTDEGTILEVQGAVDGVTDGDALIMVDDDGTVQEVQGEIVGVQDGQAQVLVDDNGTVYMVQGEIDSVRDGSATVTAIPSTGYAEAQLNWAARDRSSRITVTQIVRQQRQGTGNRGNMPGLALGGIARGIPGLSTGGLLPYTGMGTDMIMGLNSQGRHIVNVDDGEFVTRESATREYEDALWALNRHNPRAAVASLTNLPGYADGGVAGSYRPREFAASSMGITRQSGEASTSSRTVNFNFQIHHPQNRPIAETVQASLEAVGHGWDVGDVNVHNV